jgi:hypothetical protein
MVFLNRVGVVLVLVGALLFGLRDGTRQALDGHPEAIWHNGVDEVDAMISDGARDDVSGGLALSMDFAESLGEDVQGLAE